MSGLVRQCAIQATVLWQVRAVVVYDEARREARLIASAASAGLVPCGSPAAGSRLSAGEAFGPGRPPAEPQDEEEARLELMLCSRSVFDR